MSWAYENGKQGYVGESSCPVCGYPVGAIYWEDGSISLDECYACKLKKEKVPNNASQKNKKKEV